MSALTIANPTYWPVHLKPHQHQLTEALICINTSANCAAAFNNTTTDSEGCKKYHKSN